MKHRRPGERDFIESIRRHFTGNSLPPPYGIGDDAALLRSSRSSHGAQLISTDCLIETRHFSRSELIFFIYMKVSISYLI